MEVFLIFTWKNKKLAIFCPSPNFKISSFFQGREDFILFHLILCEITKILKILMELWVSSPWDIVWNSEKHKAERKDQNWEHVHVEKKTASEAFQQHQQDWWNWGIIRLGEGRGRRLDEELTLFGYLAHPIGTLPHLLEYNSYSHNLTLKFIRFFLWRWPKFFLGSSLVVQLLRFQAHERGYYY